MRCSRDEHMDALVDSANGDRDFRQFGGDTVLTTSLTCIMEDSDAAWTVQFIAGEITELNRANPTAIFSSAAKPSGGTRCLATRSMHF